MSDYQIERNESQKTPPEPGDSYDWLPGVVAWVVKVEGERTVVTIDGREHRFYTRELSPLQKRLKMSLQDLVVKPRKIAKCEQCGVEVRYTEWPDGWIQCGRSKYGNRGTIASWCPQHVAAEVSNCV